MKPRERFHKTVNHEEPDRVPMFLLAFETTYSPTPRTPFGYEKFIEYVGLKVKTQQGNVVNEQVKEMFGVDFRGVSWNFPTEKMISSTLKEDLYGVKLARSKHGSIDPLPAVFLYSSSEVKSERTTLFTPRDSK